MITYYHENMLQGFGGVDVYGLPLYFQAHHRSYYQGCWRTLVSAAPKPEQDMMFDFQMFWPESEDSPGFTK